MSFLAVGIGLGALNIGSGILGSGAARRERRRAEARRRKLQKKLNYLENNRQPIINPYEGVTNLSDLASDLSQGISNPFANLSVATQAAEMKIDQSNIALANTLDTLRATGSSAGGATALAQAALKSKAEVAASIEQQEKANEDKRAQGQVDYENRLNQEARRLQSIAMSEGIREQQAEAAGLQFEFGARESREQGRINRVAGQMGQAAQAAAQARADQYGAITGMVGGLTQIGAMAFMGSQGGPSGG
jgi:hypothetical protein